MAYSFEEITSKLKNAGTSKTSDLMHNVDTIFQNTVGRNADPSGRDYWVSKIQSGQDSYKTLFDTIGASKEFTGQQDHLAANPNATADDLKALDSAYVSPFHSGSGSIWAGWTPGDKETEAMAQVAIDNYSDQKYFTVGDVKANTNIKDTVGGVDDKDKTKTVTPIINNTTTGLTEEDLNSWWNALDKPWLNQNTNTNNNDDFMKLMMFMSMMRPMGGGGSHYGYGNITPGGVQSAYNPLANMSSYMNAFKNLPGISTNTLNATGS